MLRFLMDHGFVIMSLLANSLPALVVIVTVLANRGHLRGPFAWLERELVIERDRLHGNDAVAIGHALIKLFALWLLWTQSLGAVIVVLVAWVLIYLVTEPARENIGGALTMLGILACRMLVDMVIRSPGIGLLAAYLIVSLPWAFTPYMIERPSRTVRVWYVVGLLCHLPVVATLLTI